MPILSLLRDFGYYRKPRLLNNTNLNQAQIVEGLKEKGIERSRFEVCLVKQIIGFS
jgi:hypothetical protein